LYTIVHLVLEEFKISFKSSLGTQSLCHTVSPRVGVGVYIWARSRSPGFFTAGVGVWSPKFSHPEVGRPTKNRGSASLGPDFQKILGKIPSLV